MIKTPISLDTNELMAAINTEIARQCPSLPFEPRLFNVVIEASNRIVDEYGRESKVVKPGMSITEWLECDDTGLSSKYMASVIDGGETRMPIQFQSYEFPHDADDFGRCLRMVRALGFENKTFLMLTAGHEWRNIATHWNSLVAHYDNKKWDEFTDLLKDCISRD